MSLTLNINGYKMKRYISALLITYLFLQLVGCYTQRELTYYELSSEVDEEITIVLKDSVNYLFKKNLTTEDIVRNPNTHYCFGIDTTFESLILYRKFLTKKTGQQPSLELDTILVKKDDVTSIQTTELDLGDSILLGTGIVIATAAIIYIIVRATNPVRVSL